MDGNELVLVCPSTDMKEEILQYKEEHFASGDMQVHGSGGLAFFDSFDEWLNRILSVREKSPENTVQTSTFFSRRVSDGKLIGCIKIHHTLTEALESGGHIAYGIRPSERGKGYGTQQLALGLEYAKRQQMKQVVIACDKENKASAKTAMSCGGKLVKEFEEDGILKQHYLIEL
ncbi:MAG: GNAT family N-acetyltransferase [Clostridia bacterium]|nr:GNAT family N-acetyltransferase [Clostridia bacterium]